LLQGNFVGTVDEDDLDLGRFGEPGIDHGLGSGAGWRWAAISF
jgi:hypothetical protein